MVYRCTQDGQITLTDKPCPSAGAVTSTPTTAGSTATPVAVPQDPRLGDWQGQAQFAATQNGQNIEDAHAVVATALTFGSDARISNAPAENGCKLLGLWSPGLTPRLLTVDLTLSGCRYAGLNRRYSGSLIATFAERSAQLMLQAYSPILPVQPVTRYDVGATLRRPSGSS